MPENNSILVALNVILKANHQDIIPYRHEAASTAAKLQRFIDENTRSGRRSSALHGRHTLFYCSS